MEVGDYVCHINQLKDVVPSFNWMSEHLRPSLVSLLGNELKYLDNAIVCHLWFCLSLSTSKIGCHSASMFMVESCYLERQGGLLFCVRFGTMVSGPLIKEY